MKVLLIDDHQVILEGISLMLAQDADIEITGTASDAAKGITLVRELQPDLILADISMPGMNGIAFTEQIRRELPHIRIIILSMHSTEDFICSVVKAGANGYLTKQGTSREQLLTAIRTVMEGNDYFSPEVSAIIMKNYVSRAKKGNIQDIKPVSLTNREREILKLYADGCSNQEIADSLCISIKTVDAHKNNIMQKFNFRSTVEMVKFAIKNNLVDL